MIKVRRSFILFLFNLIFIIIFISTSEKNLKSFVLVNNSSSNGQSQNRQTNLKLSDIKEVLNKNKINGFIIVSISNYGYLNLTLNWIESMQKINFNRFVLFCLDFWLYDILVEKGYKNNLAMVPAKWIDFKINPSLVTFIQAKVQILHQLLKLNFNLMFSDVDVVWLNKNILLHIGYIFKYTSAEIIIAQDQQPNDFFYNMGLFYIKSSIFSKELFLKLIQEMQKNSENAIAQVVLNNMLRKNKFNDSRISGKYI